MDEFVITILSPGGVIYTMAVAAVGAFCGHRFDLWRDRRKEFNAFSEPAYEALTAQLGYIKAGLPGQRAIIQDCLMERYFWPMKRSRFRQAVSSYDAAMQATNGQCIDGFVHRTPESIANLHDATIALMALVKPR